ncbi:hypothetical protein [Reinekea sp. G2M2-21]|uniref:hypothetical protein n=1 Tax=Reinekea sp. G2M2-21 TaxID=2788942 RepID=UPI0018AA6205|nr:hypothetical protein [Reinekea sp. G2M2-21]
MKRLFLCLLLLIAAKYAFAGGTVIEIEVIDFTEAKNGFVIGFTSKNPKGELLETRVLIEFGCSQRLACFTQKRAFSKTQHEEAISVLRKIATPKANIKLGLIAGGYVLTKSGEKRSYGAYFDGDIVYLYGNSHP